MDTEDYCMDLNRFLSVYLTSCLPDHVFFPVATFFGIEREKNPKNWSRESLRLISLSVVLSLLLLSFCSHLSSCKIFVIDLNKKTHIDRWIQWSSLNKNIVQWLSDTFMAQPQGHTQYKIWGIYFDNKHLKYLAYFPLGTCFKQLKRNVKK